MANTVVRYVMNRNIFLLIYTLVLDYMSIFVVTTLWTKAIRLTSLTDTIYHSLVKMPGWRAEEVTINSAVTPTAGKVTQK